MHCSRINPIEYFQFQKCHCGSGSGKSQQHMKWIFSVVTGSYFALLGYILCQAGATFIMTIFHMQEEEGLRHFFSFIVSISAEKRTILCRDGIDLISLKLWYTPIQLFQWPLKEMPGAELDIQFKFPPNLGASESRLGLDLFLLKCVVFQFSSNNNNIRRRRICSISAIVLAGQKVRIKNWIHSFNAHLTSIAWRDMGNQGNSYTVTSLI